MNNSTKLKPEWLKKKISFKDTVLLKNKLSKFNLHTVCEEAFCPNISECFAKGVATVLILGDVCSRSCRFCNIKKGELKPVDENEPVNAAKLINDLDLTYVVITSVTRDDLSDRGAGQFVKTIECVKKLEKNIKIEILIPDFDADKELLKKVADTKPEVIAHNVETVRNLYPKIGRDIERYKTSLEVLRILKEIDKNIITKSGLMLGLGEKENEVLDTLKDLRNVNCSFLSVGQYLSPSKLHLPVEEFIKPEVFDKYKKIALDMGFTNVMSGPYVRSSYLACEYHN